jgi:phage baseplate assembly protein W
MVNDILLDETGDLAVSADGDLAVGISDSQHIADVLESAPGNWKQHPLVGVELMRYVNAPLTPQVRRELTKGILIQLENDECGNVEVDFDGENLGVRGEYEV